MPPPVPHRAADTAAARTARTALPPPVRRRRCVCCATGYTDVMSTIYIDADACPVTRETLTIARAHNVPVVMIANHSQNLSRYAGRKGVEIVQVSSGRDVADFAIVTRLRSDDIVVTGDIGLAAMALGRARALSFRGRVFAPETIDMELALRHAEQQHRRAGGRTRGPSPFEEGDREHFITALERMLDADGAR